MKAWLDLIYAMIQIISGLVALTITVYKQLKEDSHIKRPGRKRPGRQVKKKK